MTKILNTLRVTGTSSTSQALGVTGGYALFNDIRLSKGITYSSGSYSVAVINLTTGRVEMVSVASLGITGGSGGSVGGPNYVNPGLSGQVAFYTGATSVSGTSSLYFTQSSIQFSGIDGVSITNNTTGYLPTSVLDLIPFGGSSTYSTFRVRNSDGSSPDSLNVLYNGNVGLGTNDPQTKFHINSTQSGAFRLNDTTEGLGYYLVSDVDGVGTWTQSQQYLFGSGLTSTGEYPISTVSVDLTPYSGLTLSSGLGLDPSLAGLGLEYLGPGTSIIGIDSKVLPWSWTDGTTLSIDPDKFDYVYSIETGHYLITIDTSLVEGIDGFQFTLLKKDGDIGVVYTAIPEYDGSVNNSRLTRQNQAIQYKFDLHDLIWKAYILDEGVVPPMTVLANMGTDYAHVEEFPVIDINDTIQKSLNYTEGSFTNDWLSGTIYSCFRQLSLPTGGEAFDLTTGNYIGDTTIPAYSMVQGKSFRILVTGTITSTTGDVIIKGVLGGVILLTDSTYTPSGSLTNEPFRISYEIKVGDVGGSGLVHGSGIFTIQNDQLHLFDNTTWGQTVDTTSNNTLKVLLTTTGDASFEIYHSTIERLA